MTKSQDNVTTTTDDLEEFADTLGIENDYWVKVRLRAAVIDKLIRHMVIKYGVAEANAINAVLDYDKNGNLYHIAKEELSEDYGIK